jgi:hypothetical protein
VALARAWLVERKVRDQECAAWPRRLLTRSARSVGALISATSGLGEMGWGGGRRCPCGGTSSSQVIALKTRQRWAFPTSRASPASLALHALLRGATEHASKCSTLWHRCESASAHRCPGSRFGKSCAPNSGRDGLPSVWEDAPGGPVAASYLRTGAAPQLRPLLVPGGPRRGRPGPTCSVQAGAASGTV